MLLPVLASIPFIFSQVVSSSSNVEYGLHSSSPGYAAYALNMAVSIRVSAIVTDAIAANQALTNRKNSKIITSRSATTTTTSSYSYARACGTSCPTGWNYGNDYISPDTVQPTNTIPTSMSKSGSSCTSVAGTISCMTSSTITYWTAPTYTPIHRPFTGPNVETQVTIIGCTFPYYHIPLPTGEIPFTCPNQYISSNGTRLSLDNQGQSSQTNFTIPSINSTCEGIKIPFKLIESSVFEKNLNSNTSSVVTNSTFTDPFPRIDWNIDCSTGYMYLFNRTLHLFSSIDETTSHSLLRTMDQPIAGFSPMIYAENLMPKGV